ncbi:MAG: S8 family serine peptidase [Candidatus Thorarchaeota archaeon]
MDKTRRLTIQRFASTIIILMLVLPTPLLVVEGSTQTSVPSSIIDPRLNAVMMNSKQKEVLPIVMQFPEGSTQETMQRRISRLGLQGVILRHIFSLIPVVSLYARVSDIESLAELEGVSGIALDVVRTATAEPSFGYESFSNGAGYEHFTETLDATGMWSQGYFGNGTVVAVLDTGAQRDHPDLEGKIVGFEDLVGTGVLSYDDNGHGTACAWNVVGTGAASGGNFTGVAPGASLLIVKVLDQDGRGSDTIIAQGVEYAVTEGVDVISLSLGGPWIDSQIIVDPSVQAVRAAVSAGVAVVVASGNSGPAPFSVFSPGYADEVITVGASLDSAGAAAFSSRGPVERQNIIPHGRFAKPDITAPGSGVISGRLHSSDSFEYPIFEEATYGPSYTQWSGTSASTAQIAGLVAILKQKYASLTPLQGKLALMATAKDLGADSMEQGWGLANVTAASNLLNSSSGQLTLMTPRRYPTLPGASTVLVIGEDRPDQNITIMSTVNLGAAELEPSGNASRFVNAQEGTFTVNAGYSFISVGLNMPDELPLNATGFYIGSLTLVSGGMNVTTIDLELTITTYGGRLLADMAHHDADIDDPSFYSYFREYLREQSVVFEEFGSSAIFAQDIIDSGDLATTETFMIMDTELPYGQSEIEALHQFVLDGGTLLVLSEFYNTTSGEALFGIDSYNEILQPYGIQCERFGIGEGPGDLTGELYGLDHGGAVESDPLMNGVNNLYVVWGSTLSVNPSVAGARGLFWYDQARTRAIVAVAEAGRGKVIVVSDGSTLYDDILFDAIRGDADNLRLLRNIAVAIIPDTPRIFDVELNTHEIGEPANLTTYVFDDNLDEVTITIVGPSGSIIPGAVAERLGYLFTTEFILESGGFYDVTIVATDADDNVKTFQKTFLVPTDPADDVFITTVTFGLLAVVGVSLIYVIAIRFGGGRRRARRPVPLPDEYGPQPDEWGPPPTIE